MLLSCFSVSESVWPHRWQPTRLPHPWNSPGKNTGMGCHFLLQYMKVKSESEVAQSCRPLPTPWTAAYQTPSSMGFSRQEYWNGVPLPSPMTNLFNSMLKSRDIILPTKVYLVKAMVFPVVMYGCESWTIKKVECWRMWWIKRCFWTVVLEKTLESLLDWKEIQPVHPKGSRSWIFIDWCWCWNSNTLATRCKELTDLKRP